MGSDHFAAFTCEEGLEEKLDRFLEECEKLNDGNSLPLRVGIYPGRIQAVPVSMACDRAKFACDSLSNTFKSGYTKNTRGFAWIISSFLPRTALCRYSTSLPFSRQ